MKCCHFICFECSSCCCGNWGLADLHHFLCAFKRLIRPLITPFYTYAVRRLYFRRSPSHLQSRVLMLVEAASRSSGGSGLTCVLWCVITGEVMLYSVTLNLSHLNQLAEFWAAGWSNKKWGKGKRLQASMEMREREVGCINCHHWGTRRQWEKAPLSGKVLGSAWVKSNMSSFYF